MRDMKTRILEAIKKFNTPDYYSTMMLARQKELVAMVDRFGTHHVALAAGITENTLDVYLRTKRLVIGITCITRAQYVFDNI